ncbi:class 1 fructose-bisphosphatase [Polluticaenibacter yanchengensis]|uniref:Fructose-1,6-bisphosphatase class 1 n=1 Tax=Polluticaenibacter yanchengensis TaxID=3014562 RepID=A0ABT4UGM5_9BACT|nr:class 1 fructose-bisphosphatase [Chitinophagaceae bacterium LY-5]
MLHPRKLMTLDEFTIYELRTVPHATGELSGLMRSIGLACKKINSQVNRAGLSDILGALGTENVQGEEVQKLDDIANRTFIDLLNHSIYCAGVGSEENDDIVIFDDPISNNSKYVLLMDPLDGSGNIDVGVSIGTIFSVLKRVTPLGTPVTIEDFLQPGNRIVAAGYVIYGSSTMLIYGTKRGMNGFTLDPTIGEFCLSHPNLKCPDNGKFYSANYGNYLGFSEGVKSYLKACERKTKDNGGPYTERYIGSMVADIHRNLIKGGIFMYPGTMSKPNGKLRLLYECNPMAFIYQVCGGYATNGEMNVLDIQPTELHQRTPLFIGSKNMMAELEEHLKLDLKS